MSIEKMYNVWAQQYDANENKTRDLDQRIVKEILTKYEFSKVIELGCGTGKNTSFLLTKAEAIIGIDFSQEMLNKAKEKIRDERVRFIKANLLQSWEVSDEYADLISCSLVLEHIEDMSFVFNEANKKLKEWGLLFISEYHPFKQYLGKKARFETAEGTQELEAYVHHTSEYLREANRHGFHLVELNEHFDDIAEKGMPRLISLLFRKS